jgi:hypothetical protein
MAAAENKAVVSSFVEEVINQGRLEWVNDHVALDFVELDPLPGRRRGNRQSENRVLHAKWREMSRPEPVRRGRYDFTTFTQ